LVSALLFIGLISFLTMCFDFHWFFSFRFISDLTNSDTPLCFVYDHSIPPGTSGQFTSLPSLPIGRAAGSLVYITALNALFYTGGARRRNYPDYIGDFRDSWLLLLDGGINATWTAKQPLPYFSNHMSFASAKDNGGVHRYFFNGGQLGKNEENGNQVNHYEYDVTNDWWIPRKNMAVPRGHAYS
jgi:hypothetical protein